MFYQTQMSLIFLVLFSDMGQCLRPAQTKSLKKSKIGHVRIIEDSIHNINISGLYISWLMNFELGSQKIHLVELPLRDTPLTMFWVLISPIQRNLRTKQWLKSFKIQHKIGFQDLGLLKLLSICWACYFAKMCIWCFDFHQLI